MQQMKEQGKKNPLDQTNEEETVKRLGVRYPHLI